MILEILICISLLVIPYGFWGFNISNLIVLVLPLIYLIKKKKIYGDKWFLVISLVYFIIAILSLFISSGDIVSISGIAPYMSIGLFYIIFNGMIKDESCKEKILKIMVNTLAILAVAFIVIQWVIFDTRIDGNIAYANSYALILLIGIYISGELKTLKYSNLIEIILTMGILFTGSRTTLVCYMIFILCRVLKKDKIFKKHQVLNILTSIIVYIIIDKSIIVAMLILPIVLYILPSIYKIKIKKRYLNIVVLLIVLLVVVTPTNTFERIKNISLSNGSLQERFILFEDGINAIANKPSGYGINMYEHEISQLSSAFYEVRYIHNSLLQVGFEVGILGLIFMLLLFIYGGILIYKNKKISYHLIIYILVCLHSLMDFDFTYVSVIAMWILLISINTEVNKVKLGTMDDLSERIIKYLSLLIVILVAIIAILEANIAIAKLSLKSENFVVARKVLNTNHTNDWRVKSLLADTYKQEYDNTSNEECLKESIRLLEETRSEIKNNETINYNLAYNYRKIGDLDSYIYLMKDILEFNKFNKEYYDDFYRVVYRLNKKENKEEYKLLLLEIEDNFNENKKILNKRAKFIKNQLGNFEYTTEK